MPHANQLGQLNQWEGWTMIEGQPEIFRLLSQVGTAINNIERAAPGQAPVSEQCAQALEDLTKLANYIQEKKYE